MGSFPEVRIVADRLEFTEFGPGDAATVKALVKAGDLRRCRPKRRPGHRRSTGGWPTACTGTGRRVLAST